MMRVRIVSRVTLWYNIFLKKSEPRVCLFKYLSRVEYCTLSICSSPFHFNHQCMVVAFRVITLMMNIQALKN
jgi:hypothetical protein